MKPKFNYNFIDLFSLYLVLVVYNLVLCGARKNEKIKDPVFVPARANWKINIKNEPRCSEKKTPEVGSFNQGLMCIRLAKVYSFFLSKDKSLPIMTQWGKLWAKMTRKSLPM